MSKDGESDIKEIMMSESIKALLETDKVIDHSIREKAGFSEENLSLFHSKGQEFIGNKDGFTPAEAGKFIATTAGLPFTAVALVYLGIACLISKFIEIGTTYKRRGKLHKPFEAVTSGIFNAMSFIVSGNFKATTDVMIGCMEEVDTIYNSMRPATQKAHWSYFYSMMGSGKAPYGAKKGIMGHFPNTSSYSCGASSLDNPNQFYGHRDRFPTSEIHTGDSMHL